ncbi:hypothetical protein VNI00_000580 [Paramarasmius palmivorus]|uniref:Uncharacterized protein n=1 Tax=Paramarasmius palmivorus TaxID=297713 RepID=A0AAW0EBQ5_9AGAR
MAFTGASDFTIEGDATNIVLGDQYSINRQIIKIASRVGGTRRAVVTRKQSRKQAADDLDQVSLLEKYREIIRGDIYKIEEIGTRDFGGLERDEQGKMIRLDFVGQRDFYRAEVYGANGREFTTVTYHGRDALKIWKRDFKKYSQSDSRTRLLQLFGVNSSKVPALIFYDEWLPMAHLYGKDLFWTPLYIRSLSRTMNCESHELWLNSKKGHFSSGPAGPSFGSHVWPFLPDSDDLPRMVEMLKPDTYVEYLSKGTAQLDDLDSSVLRFAYSRVHALCIKKLLGMDHLCSSDCPRSLEWKEDDNGLWQVGNPSGIIPDDVSVLLDGLCFDAVYSGMEQREIARIYQGLPRSEWSASRDSMFINQEIVDGLTRFSFDSKGLGDSDAISSYSTISAHAWLSQAHRIFSVQGDRDPVENEKCWLPQLILQVTKETEAEPDLDPLRELDYVHLFVQPPPTQFSEVRGWANEWRNSNVRSYAEMLGTAEDGLEICRSAISFMAKVARGFDPTTLDFACSAGMQDGPSIALTHLDHRRHDRPTKWHSYYRNGSSTRTAHRINASRDHPDFTQEDVPTTSNGTSASVCVKAWQQGTSSHNEDHTNRGFHATRYSPKFNTTDLPDFDDWASNRGSHHYILQSASIDSDDDAEYLNVQTYATSIQSQPDTSES